jgi:hypothetical protein
VRRKYKYDVFYTFYKPNGDKGIGHARVSSIKAIFPLQKIAEEIECHHAFKKVIITGYNKR